MSTFRLSFGKIALEWTVLLFSAALIFPNLSIQTRTHPAVKIMIATYWVLLLIGTPISLGAYFRRAWRKSATVSNKRAYLAWLSLEAAGAVGILIFLFYATIAAVVGLR